MYPGSGGGCESSNRLASVKITCRLAATLSLLSVIYASVNIHCSPVTEGNISIKPVTTTATITTTTTDLCCKRPAGIEGFFLGVLRG